MYIFSRDYIVALFIALELIITILKPKTFIDHIFYNIFGLIWFVMRSNMRIDKN